MSLLSKQIQRYSDIPINMSVHPIRGDLIPVTDIDALKRSVRNAILTGKDERRFQPSWDNGIYDYFFENSNSSDAAFAIKKKVRERIKYKEPRARVLDVSVNLRPDNNFLSIRIVFAALNNPNPVTLDVILEKVR